MQEETLKGYGKVWYDEEEIANIFPFRNMREKYPVRYNNEENFCLVMNPDREIILRQRKSGLYFHSMSNREVVLVNIVKDIR